MTVPLYVFVFCVGLFCGLIIGAILAIVSFIKGVNNHVRNSFCGWE